jgi:hypothetical protein
MKLGYLATLDGGPARQVGPPRPTFVQITDLNPDKYSLLLPAKSVKKV